MYFPDYLKHCREAENLTQEHLVESLYLYDNNIFQGLTPVTFSRWETGKTKPSYKRISKIIEFFQLKTNSPLPYIYIDDDESIEKLICHDNIQELFHPKQMVGKVTLHTSTSDFNIINIKQHPRSSELLDLNYMLHTGANAPFTQVQSNQFQEWMNYSSSLFLAAMYKESFLGLLFCIKLKTNAFNDLLQLKLKKSELSNEHFADKKEEGSLYLLSFYSLSPQIATLLFQRFYAHCIVHQHDITNIGFLSSYKEAKELGEKLDLSIICTKKEDNLEISSFSSSLKEIFKSPTTLKILFPNQEC